MTIKLKSMTAQIVFLNTIRNTVNGYVLDMTSVLVTQTPEVFVHEMAAEPVKNPVSIT